VCRMTVPRAQETIDKMAHERDRLIAWVRSVPAEQWANVSPGGIWQARDYVAHLASIDPLLVGIMRGFQGERGAALTAAAEFNIDEWNEGKIMQRRSRSIEDLIAEMARSRVDLNAAFGDFTDEQLDGTFRFRGDAKRLPRDLGVADFLRGLVYHDRWHMEDARRAIAGEAEQPFGDKDQSNPLQGAASG